MRRADKANQTTGTLPQPHMYASKILIPFSRCVSSRRRVYHEHADSPDIPPNSPYRGFPKRWEVGGDESSQ